MTSGISQSLSTPYTSSISGRHDQAFPVLSETEISRIARFGEHRQYRRGERLFTTGEPPPGIFVVLKGTLTMTQRDGLGHLVPIVRHGPGQFTGEVAQLSSGVALVDADADDDLDALLLPLDQLRALIVAEADLGERVVRALILRRVALIESGGSGAVLIGDLQSRYAASGEFSPSQRPAAPRSGPVTGRRGCYAVRGIRRPQVRCAGGVS
jgi:thioredoxin reductase (NADPH)